MYSVWSHLSQNGVDVEFEVDAVASVLREAVLCERAKLREEAASFQGPADIWKAVAEV